MKIDNNEIQLLLEDCKSALKIDNNERQLLLEDCENALKIEYHAGEYKRESGFGFPFKLVKKGFKF